MSRSMRAALATLAVVVAACSGPVLANPPVPRPVVTPAPSATRLTAPPWPTSIVGSRVSGLTRPAFPPSGL